MIHEKIDMRNEGSMEYAALYTYLLDNSPEIGIENRPVVIICPGGGYGMTSDREAEIVAMQFCAMGYHAAVLRYSVAPARFPAALLELGKAVRTMRQNAAKWHVDTERIVICGFSAGGHMAGSYGTFWSEDWVGQALEAASEELRPNGMILCYPVITSGNYAHVDSFKNLLGDDYEKKKDSVSLEKHVNADVPRTFLWHTAEDDCVPVQNSLMYASVLAEQKIPVELHIFEKGGHGLSLGSRLTCNQSGYGLNPACQRWLELVHTWIENCLTEE